MNYTPPLFDKSAFNCAICGAYAKQIWTTMQIFNRAEPYHMPVEDPKISVCTHCWKHSIWQSKKLIFPNTGTSPLPNDDMPTDIKADYNEARAILNLSPRGAAALLRLAIQKLCKHLGGTGENINHDIAILVKNGLPTKLQQALDSVRVVGNNAVHPGHLDLKDDIETANKLFAFINIICDNQITQPKQINEFYEEKIPENLKNAIEKRDSK
jgi:hypothetical protein